MSRSTIVLLVVATSPFVGLNPQVALGQDSGLKSVLISEDDLRPLVDLNTPSAEVIVTPTDEAAIAPIPDPADAILPVQPVPSPTRKSVTNSASPLPASNADTKAALPKRDSSESPTATRVVSADPMFDVGVAVVPVAGGAQVRGVFVDSPAQKSGVRAGDTIVGIDGKRANTAYSLTEQLANTLSRTDRFVLNIQRRGRSLVLPIDTASTNATVRSNERPQSSNANQTQSLTDTRAIVRDTIQRQIRALRISDPATAPAVAPSNRATSTNANAAASNSNANANRTPAAGQTIPTPPNPRPLVGESGRLIGNGRLINSARRLFGN